MGYFLESGRSYEGARRGLQPSGLRPVRDPEEEKRQARIEAIYATRPLMLAGLLRDKKLGEITEIMDQSLADNALVGSIGFNPNDILGAGDFSIVYPAKLRGRVAQAALKVFLPDNYVWGGLPVDPNEKRKALNGLAVDEWEVLQLGTEGVVKGIARGHVQLTRSTSLPLLIREYHPHTVSSMTAEFNNLEKRRAIEDRVPVMLQAAEELGGTLDALRERGVIVTDMSTHNIFVTNRDHFLIGDVGGAVREGRNSPQFTFGVSDDTSPPEYFPNYMQEGMSLPGIEVATPQAQVYSLAALLHIIAGGRPFDKMDRYMPQEFKDLERLGLSDSMAGTLRKALSRDPQDRYETPGEFARALKAST